MFNANQVKTLGAGGLAGAVMTIIGYVLARYGITIPEEVSDAGMTIIVALVGWWLHREAPATAAETSEAAAPVAAQAAPTPGQAGFTRLGGALAVAAAGAAMLLMLGGCAGNPITGSTGPQATVDQLVNADAQAALADATASGDTLAATCYSYLVKITTPAAGSAAPACPAPGLLCLQQKARDLANGQKNNSRIAGLNVACAPLVFSDQATLNALVLPGALTP